MKDNNLKIECPVKLVSVDIAGFVYFEAAGGKQYLRDCSGEIREPYIGDRNSATFGVYLPLKEQKVFESFDEAVVYFDALNTFGVILQCCQLLSFNISNNLSGDLRKESYDTILEAQSEMKKNQRYKPILEEMLNQKDFLKYLDMTPEEIYLDFRGEKLEKLVM